MDIDSNNSLQSSFPSGNIYNNNAGNLSFVGPQQPLNQAVFGLIIPGCPVRTDFVPIIDTPGLPASKYSLNLSSLSDITVPILSITDIVIFATAGNVNGAVTSASPSQQNINNITIIPPDYGVLCYWQITQQLSTMSQETTSTGFALFGALTNTQPSAVFRTGWSEHEQLVAMVQSSTNGGVMASNYILSIGLSIEPISNVHNLLGTINAPSSVLPNFSTDVGSIINTTTNTNTTNHRLYVAQKIALDLFNFMQSFDTTNGNGTTSHNSNIMMVPTNIFDRWYQRFENRYRRDPNFFLKESND